MADPAAIEALLQARLEEHGLDEVPAVEAAAWLDEAGLLKDRPDKPGAPLRELLRGGSVSCAEQRPPRPNGRWWIVRGAKRGARRTKVEAGSGVPTQVWRLTENDVVDAVCGYLETRGFKIVERATTTQRGRDVLARRDSPRGPIEVAVEAKGATSSKPGTQRHGQPFSANQVLSHVARALYTAASAEAPTNSAIALPRTPVHEARIASIGSALERLGVSVLWVAADRSVELEGRLEA